MQQREAGGAKRHLRGELHGGGLDVEWAKDTGMVCSLSLQPSSHTPVQWKWKWYQSVFCNLWGAARVPKAGRTTCPVSLQVQRRSVLWLRCVALRCVQPVGGSALKRRRRLRRRACSASRCVLHVALPHDGSGVLTYTAHQGLSAHGSKP